MSRSKPPFELPRPGSPLLLDLFCKAGGATVGYRRAGFEVFGVDIEPQPHYPGCYHVEDATEVLGLLARGKTWHGWDPRDFAAIHASPPCQSHSCTRHLPNAGSPRHPDCLAATRDLLEVWARKTGGVYVIENVKGAPMSPFAITLCGISFGLKVFRHRLFESNVLLLAQPHTPHGERKIGKGGFCCVAGHGGQSSGFRDRRRLLDKDHRTVAAWRRAMGIDWMTRDELSQAIPPAYTEYLGRQLMNAINNRRAT